MAFFDVVGSAGAKNVSIINVTPSGDLTNVALDNGLFDFDANDVTKVQIKVGDQILDTTMTAARSVEFSGADLEVEFGDFDLETGIYINIEVAVWIGASLERIVIAGPGRETEIRLTFHA
jgi:hypothetical protein